jgi:UDP-glucose 4-epimerase
MILVTGGMGFIGLHVVKRLLDAGESVVVTWNHSWRVPEFWGDELGKRVIAERVDVTYPHDVLSVAKKHSVESIIHLATPVVGTASPSQDYMINMHGLLNVLEAARLVGARRLTFAGSSTLYSGLNQGPYREDALLPIDSRTSTEAFKKACETLLFHYADRAELSVVSVRPRQVYGPMYYSLLNLPSRLCHAAVKGTEPNYGPAGPPYGDDTSDFTYVKDCAEVLTGVNGAASLQHRVYNVGGGRAFTMQELVDAVKEMVPDAKVEVRPGVNPRGNPPDNYLDLTRVKEDLGFTPRYPIDQGVADYVSWLQNHPL